MVAGLFAIALLVGVALSQIPRAAFDSKILAIVLTSAVMMVFFWGLREQTRQR